MILVITINLGQQWRKPYPGGGHSQKLGKRGRLKKTAQIWWETLLRQLACLTLD